MDKILLKTKKSHRKSKKIILIRAGSTSGRLPHALLPFAANLEDEVLIITDNWWTESKFDFKIQRRYQECIMCWD